MVGREVEYKCYTCGKVVLIAIEKKIKKSFISPICVICFRKVSALGVYHNMYQTPLKERILKEMVRK